VAIWHPKYGMLFDEYEKIKNGSYPPPIVDGEDSGDRGGGCTVRPPPEQYSYRCSQCQLEMEVNEAISDVEIGIAEFEGDG
jgi:hypothetical protein